MIAKNETSSWIELTNLLENRIVDAEKQTIPQQSFESLTEEILANDTNN